MFMEVAIGAIGIGVVLMVGYIVVSQVRSALPTSVEYQVWNGSENVMVSAGTNISTAQSAVQTTVFAGFGLIAVGIIVLAAFGLITIFK